MRRLLYLWLAVFAPLSVADVPLAEGPLEDSACLACHQQQDADLVSAWQDSAHAQTGTAARCVDCHGDTHAGAAARARRDGTCVACHGGKDSPVVHSYATSKHGILVRLEQDEWDWNLPLARANYRAPGCAYCHMHKGNHNVSAGARPWDAGKGADAAERERVQDATRAVCQDCHSSRYITRLFDNGEAMLAIGRMKVQEAEAVVDQAEKEFSGEALRNIRKQFEKMQSSYLKNVYLGIGHQSPDYQWWHGQPGLDGDLLRIKGAVGELRRLNASGSTGDGT